ncbi:MAG TPA: AAA family ATPase [Treponemataceae bacterium]|nr:AAA family ATPase [Treponemataceae bacterium]
MIKLENYSLHEMVYENAHTLIYRGTRDSDGLPIIAKLIRKQYHTQEELQKLEQEFRLLQELSHPGIVRYVDLVAFQSSKAIIMEENESVTLQAFIHKTKPDLAVLIDLACQIAAVVSYVHGKGFVLRDIKSTNIIVDPAGPKARFIDFGLATMLRREIQDFVSYENLQGTLAYMSPEQTGRIDRPMDFRSDLYSLGVTLYEMFTGGLPFRYAEPIELVHAHLAMLPVAPHKRKQAVPRQVSDIIMKLLEKDPALRYQTAIGLEADLKSCAESLRASGEIAPFELAREDFSSDFILTDRIFGREAETELVLEEFARAANGENRMLVFTGPGGIGKSRVIAEARKPLGEREGLFTAGKFEQFRQDIPYSAWIQCFESLVRQILAEPEARLKEAQANILELVGENGQVLIDLVPEIAAVIGPQRSVPALGSGENQTRFFHAFVAFVKAFARKGSPLVISLDDIHWADQASLSLIGALLEDLSVGNLLIIASYRNDEVTDDHPVAAFFRHLDAAGVHWWQRRELTPLSPEATDRLIAETLHRPIAEIADIAEAIRGKTGNNPFFVREFLMSLRKSGCIEFERGWKWDIEKVRAARMSDTVAALFAERIKTFGPETVEMLGTLACMGNDVDIGFAALILGIPHDELATVLAPAFNEGILEKIGSQIRFGHDRIIEALTSGMRPNQKVSEHRRIAEFMLATLSPAERDERLFELVYQLNAARQAIADPDVRLQTANLNIRAGRKAFKSGAYESAFAYYEIADELIPHERWHGDRAFMIEFATDFSEILYLTGRIARAEEEFSLVLANTRDILERVRLYEIMITCYTSVYRLEEAIAVGREALAQLGVFVPHKPSLIHTLMLLARTFLANRSLSPEKITGLPAMTDPKQLAIMRLLMATSEPSYLGDPIYLGILVFNMILRSVAYGNCPSSAYAWSGFAVIMTNGLKIPALGKRYAEAALSLAASYDDKTIRCKVNFMIGDMIAHWTAPLRDSLPYLLDSYHGGNETGNHLWASYALNNYLFYTFFKGDSLHSVQKKFERYYPVMKRYDQPHARECYELWFQLTKSAISDEDGIKLGGDVFDEKDAVEHWKRGNARSAFGYYVVARLVASFFNGDWEAGIEMANEGKQAMYGLLGMFFVVEYHYYRALNYIALGMKTRRSRSATVHARKSLAVLSRLGETAPDVAHKAAIVRGGILILAHKFSEATTVLDGAISNARVSGYGQDVAIACELAARAFQTMGAQSLARSCMTEAYHGYVAWGLCSKARRLLECFDYLIAKGVAPGEASLGDGTLGHGDANADSVPSTGSSGSESLDLAAIIKASNILNGTIVLDELLERLIRVVMENAGAQRSVLLLRSDSGYQVTVEGTSGETLRIQNHNLPLEQYDDIPESAIAYAVRTRQRLLINRGEMVELFQRDPYIKARDPAALLVQPLLHQGNLVGILYLEHRQTDSAFTPKSLQILSMLSTQIAISVDNAMLYRDQRLLTESYSRFVPQEFITFLGKESIRDVSLGDQVERDMTILFSDMRNFTSISETMTPENNFNFLNDYLARVSPIVRANEGFIDKYIGDAIMALFPKHPVDAVNTAVAIQAEIRRHNDALPQGSPARLEVGIGIHGGRLMLGTIGERERLETTVISDAVNVASRLESLTKAYGTPIIVSEAIVRGLDPSDRFMCRYLDTVRPAGRTQAIELWEIIDGTTNEIRELKLASKPAFDEGLRLYREKKFAEATTIFHNILIENPGDIPARIYRDRAQYWSTHRMNESWDGIQILRNK